jgi:hypothetical protein
MPTKKPVRKGPPEYTAPPSRISNETLSVQVQYVNDRLEKMDDTLSKVADSLSAYARLDERLLAHLEDDRKVHDMVAAQGTAIIKINEKLGPLMSTRRWLLWGFSGLASLIGVQAFNAWTNVQSMVELQKASIAATQAAAALPAAAEKLQKTLETPIDQRKKLDAAPVTPNP